MDKNIGAQAVYALGSTLERRYLYEYHEKK